MQLLTPSHLVLLASVIAEAEPKIITISVSLSVEYCSFQINFCHVYSLIYSLIWFYVLCINAQ